LGSILPKRSTPDFKTRLNIELYWGKIILPQPETACLSLLSDSAISSLFKPPYQKFISYFGTEHKNLYGAGYARLG